MRSGLTVARLGELDVHAAEAQVLSMVGRVAPAAFPMLAGLLVSAALIGFAQAGFRLRSETMGFQLERINPATGWRRLLSVRSLIQLASALIKISIILGIVYASSGDLVSRIQVLARERPRERRRRDIVGIRPPPADRRGDPARRRRRLFVSALATPPRPPDDQGRGQRGDQATAGGSRDQS